MKYVIISVEEAKKAGYIPEDEEVIGNELMIGEDGYAYIDDNSNDPFHADWNWDFGQAAEDFPICIVEI
jgi:hypothetical protein